MEDKIVVYGGANLKGKVKVNGAKNAILPLIAASVLSKRKIKLFDVPFLEDVKTMIKLLTSIGVHVEVEKEVLHIDAEEITSVTAPIELVHKMRASFIILGPLLARKKRACIPMPGGCAIGSRPVDQHLKGLKALGAKFKIEDGFVQGFAEKLIGTTIYLDFPSVGATQNIMMAATLSLGRTVIENAACEPEITDLANFLNTMGAKIRGAGTDEIRIDGVLELCGTEYTVIPDRIEAATYMASAAITRGEVFIEGVITDHLTSVISKMREMGVSILEDENGILVSAKNGLSPVDVKTLPYPGFPTDAQSQMMVLLLTANGVSILTETVFENRFMHVEELKRMGAMLKVQGRSVIIEGGKPLYGAKVRATDLRAGAALVLAALIAKGKSEIVDVYHIDRGYVNFIENLKCLGANIERFRT